jgi:mono/diheme cytochrome c family protein
MSRRARWVWAIAATALLLLLGALFTASRRYVEAPSAQLQAVTLGGGPVPPAARFAFDDLGGLSTHTLRSNAAPWKLIVAALLARRPDLLDSANVVGASRIALREFGFITPDTILNWTGPRPTPEFDQPLGVVTGALQLPLPGLELEVANVGCPACHSGVTYDATGSPLRTAWLGTPNTSVNFEAYVTAVYDGLRILDRDPAGVLGSILRLFPDLSSDEHRALRWVITPQVARRLRTLEASGASPLPFHNGAPGLTNGVASLKYQAGILVADARVREVGFTSIPDLADRSLRSSLLYDGAYAPPGAPRFAERQAAERERTAPVGLASIVAFFTVPAFGTAPRRAEAAIASVEAILEFLTHYRPPSFPGVRDTALALRGRDLYSERCAACHGRYDAGVLRPRLQSFPNRHVPQALMGTDPTRWKAIDRALLDYIARSRSWSAHVSAARTGGYVAPLLSGIWITAPYLHNGSVPTLWHLLDPISRPGRFYTGGHRLRFDLVGIDGRLDDTGVWRYPTGYMPWAGAVLYDTREPGRSNAGHTSEVAGLSDRERLALIEYLKGL